MMDFYEFMMALGLGLLVVVIAFVMSIGYTFFGWLSGFVISITPLNSLVEEGFQALGLDVAGKIPSLGATFGFITGFVKGIISIKTGKGE